MNKTEKIFGSAELANHFKNYLLAQCSIIKGILSESLDKRIEKIKIVLASSCNTATAIVKLCDDEDYFYAEAVMLARAFVEKIVNFCYLLRCEEKEYDNFIKYTVQKSFRKLNRSASTNGTKLEMKFNHKINLDEHPALKASLEEFTSKKGKEITRWTNKSMEDRINILEKNGDLNVGLFLMDTLSIYEDASEALHGTLYGCSFHTWVYEPGIDVKNKDDVKKNTFKKITLLCWQLGSLLHETITIVSKNNEIGDYLKGSSENSKNALEIMKAVMNEK